MKPRPEPTDWTKKPKSPLGLTPLSIHNYSRYNEILEAIQRYHLENKQVPSLWLDELVELNNWFVMNGRR